MNTPYVKSLDSNGKVTNPITKEKPYLNSFASNRGNRKKRYVMLINPLTGQFGGKLRARGNNRASTCKNSDGCKCRKHKNSRGNKRF